MRGDPYWLTVKRDDFCAKCHLPIKRGTRGFYYPLSRTLHCDRDNCGGQAARDFAAHAQDDAMIGGM